MKPFALASLVALACAAPAFGQQSPAGWSYPQFAPAPLEPLPAPLAEAPRAQSPAPQPGGFPTYAPERPAPVEELPPPPRENGQQHWVSLNLSVFQPFVGRVGLMVWPGQNNSLWLEAFAGSVLFERMYGFGLRLQHTAWTFGSGGRIMLSPGLGVHILPTWSYEAHEAHLPSSIYGWSTYYDRNSLAYVYGDVDLSWLHDFTPHFGYEVGIKLGLAGRVAGKVGETYPRFVMFGRDLYPILAIYSGFRF